MLPLHPNLTKRASISFNRRMQSVADMAQLVEQRIRNA